MKEISKGLCLHYTLNNNGNGQENLVKGMWSATATASEKNTSGSATITLPSGYSSLNDFIGKTVVLSYDYSMKEQKECYWKF